MPKIPFQDLDESQKKALSIVQNEPHRNLFIQGQAGTGKSTLIEHIKGVLEQQSQQYAVVAPSGIAAELIGGSTIHRLFKLGAREYYPLNVVDEYQLYQEIVKYIDTLIIDEASMLRADIFDTVDILCQKAKDNAAPFGGIRVILVGDLHQLPPVCNFKLDAAKKYIRETYHTLEPFFFDAACYAHGNFGFIELKKNHRQDGDNKFIHHLGIIRKGREGNLQAALDYFNGYVIDGEIGEDVPVVTATRETANEINEQRLGSINSPEYKYLASISGSFYEGPEGENRIEDFHIPQILRLKLGARVMICKNEGQYVNGSMGRVIGLDSGIITVRLDNGDRVELKQAIWTTEEYFLNDEGKLALRTIGTFKQFPLKLAYAITIHKSQGQTWDNVCVDITGGYAFAAGQVYVALSRVRTIEGVHLRRKLTDRDILVNPSITKFLKDKGIVRPRHNKENDEAKKEPAIEMVAPDNNLPVFEAAPGHKISQLYNRNRRTWAIWTVQNWQLEHDILLWAGKREKNPPDPMAYIFKIPAGTYTTENFVEHNDVNVFPNGIPNVNRNERDIKIDLNTFKEMLMPCGQKVKFKKHLWKTIDYDANEVIDNPDYQE
ncbi:MAG: DEAD/DEAH box helicase [Akkermansia sp.]|nr:DEAD/DEAH box helicase [Akkermansia sp.]